MIILQALQAMLFGMLGIFIVMSIIMVSINILNRLDRNKNEK